MFPDPSEVSFITERRRGHSGRIGIQREVNFLGRGPIFHCSFDVSGCVLDKCNWYIINLLTILQMADQPEEIFTPLERNPTEKVPRAFYPTCLCS